MFIWVHPWEILLFLICGHLFADVGPVFDIAEFESGNVCIALAARFFQVFSDGSDTEKTTTFEFIVIGIFGTATVREKNQ